MKRKLKIGLLVCIVIWLASLWVSPLLFFLLAGLGSLVVFGIAFLLIANQF